MYWLWGQQYHIMVSDSKTYLIPWIKTRILSGCCLPTDAITESTVNHSTFQFHHLLPGNEVCVVKTSYFQRHKPIATLPLLWNKFLDQMQCCVECHEGHIMSLLGGPEGSSLLWNEPRLVSRCAEELKHSCKGRSRVWRLWGPHGKSPRKQPSGVQEAKAGRQGDTGDQDAAAGVRQKQGEDHQAWAGAKRPVSSPSPAGTQLQQNTSGCPHTYAPLTVQQEQEKPKHRRLESGSKAPFFLQCPSSALYWHSLTWCSLKGTAFSLVHDCRTGTEVFVWSWGPICW